MDQVGYIVIEFNQASGQPGVDHARLCATEDEAQEIANDLRFETARVGRRERYAVAEVTLIEEPR